MYKRIISTGFLKFFPNLIFSVNIRVKGEKMAQKDNISRVFLHFFQILIFVVNSGVKVQKMDQNDKNCICCTPYLRKHTSYDCDFWYTCAK